MTLVAESFAPDLAPAATSRAAPVTMEFLPDDRWEDTIATFDGVCQEQLLTFAKHRWPGVVQEPLVFRLNGEIVGGSLMMIQRLPLRVGAIAISKWGPMLAHTDRADAMAVYGGMIDRLVDEYAIKRRMMISVLPRAALGELNPEYAHLMHRGFRAGARLLFPNRYIVNLRLDDAAQRKSLEQKWRYHLNKSERAGLSFEHAGPERRPEFDALYETMVDRKKFPDHSAYDTVPGLFGMANDTLRPELFFVRHEGEVIAGAIIFKAGDRAVYLYGATTEKALPLRAGYFMHWHIIRWLRDNTSAVWYDLGGTDGFHGLHQFKKGMVGSAGVISPVPRVANYAAYPIPFFLGEAAFAARELLHVTKRKIDRLRADRANPDQQKHVEKPIDGSEMPEGGR